jgi:hypothetical protein
VHFTFVDLMQKLFISLPQIQLGSETPASSPCFHCLRAEAWAMSRAMLLTFHVNAITLGDLLCGEVQDHPLPRDWGQTAGWGWGEVGISLKVPSAF